MAEKLNNKFPQTGTELVGTTDPSLVTGNVAAPDEEQLEERLYQQKVQFLETMLEDQTKAAVDAKKDEIGRKIGRREVESVDVWEAAKGQIGRVAYRAVGIYIDNHTEDWSKPDEEKDVFDEVLSQVANDYRGTLDKQRTVRGPDVTNFTAGYELDGLIDGGELNNPATLEKATDTIRLLVNYGFYKFHRYGNAYQLKTALKLLQTYTEYVPDFNPQEAGFVEAQQVLVGALAVLRLDNQTKPNYPYAKPERSHLIGQTLDSLASLRTTEAHFYLRYNDFELPQESSVQVSPDEVDR